MKELVPTPRSGQRRWTLHGQSTRSVDLRPDPGKPITPSKLGVSQCRSLLGTEESLIGSMGGYLRGCPRVFPLTHQVLVRRIPSERTPSTDVPVEATAPRRCPPPLLPWLDRHARDHRRRWRLRPWLRAERASSGSTPERNKGIPDASRAPDARAAPALPYLSDAAGPSWTSGTVRSSGLVSIFFDSPLRSTAVAWQGRKALGYLPKIGHHEGPWHRGRSSSNRVSRRPYTSRNSAGAKARLSPRPPAWAR